MSEGATPSAVPARRGAHARGWMRLGARLRSGLGGASAGAFLVLAGGAGAGYLAQVGTARLVGVDSFGLYMYALAWTTVAATLSTLGFHVSLLRLVPACRARGDWARARGAIHLATVGTAASGLLVAAAAGGLLAAAGAAETERGLTLLIAMAAAPLLALQLVGAATVRALGGAVAGLAPERLGRDPIALAALAAMVGLGLAPAAAPTAMAGMLLSAAITAAIVFALRRRRLPPELRAARPAYAVAEWTRPTLPLTGIMAADVIMARGGVIVLGLASDAREAGVFAVAVALSTLAALPRMAVAAAFAPQVADLHARGEQAALQALLSRAAALSFAGALAVGAALAATAPWLLSLFGRGFGGALIPVFILIAGQLVAAAAGPQQHVVTMTGREGAAAAMHGAAALLGLVLCFALAGPFGAAGAAAAGAGAIAVWNLAMAVYIRARLGLRPGLLAFAQP